MNGQPKLKIAILDDFEKLADTVPSYEKLKGRADVTILENRLDSSENLVSTLRDFDVLLLMRERTFFSDKEYAQLPKLKFIAQTGRTSKHLDLANATLHGIAIAGTAADNGRSTAELSIALILALLRKIPQVNLAHARRALAGNRRQHLGGKDGRRFRLRPNRQNGGAHYQSFRRNPRARLFALAHRRGARPRSAPKPWRRRFSGANRIFSPIHISSTAQTRGSIGEKEFAMMKRGVLLVNTARGPIISEPAMLDALRRSSSAASGWTFTTSSHCRWTTRCAASITRS